MSASSPLAQTAPLPPLIELDRASVVRGQVKVLDSLSLRIDQGDHTAILGPNGCGKSSWRGQREIHEAASVDGPVRTLRGDLIHYPYRSLEQQLAKTQRYARMMAEHEFARGKRASWTKLVLSPAWRFWRGYVLRAGFLDGWRGLVYAYVRANYVRQKAIMLWLLQHGQPVADPPRE